MDENIMDAEAWQRVFRHIASGRERRRAVHDAIKHALSNTSGDVEWAAEVRALKASGIAKIPAIREIRVKYGIGLLEAKRIVDDSWNS